MFDEYRDISCMGFRVTVRQSLMGSVILERNEWRFFFLIIGFRELYFVQINKILGVRALNYHIISCTVKRLMKLKIFINNESFCSLLLCNLTSKHTLRQVHAWLCVVRRIMIEGGSLFVFEGVEIFYLSITLWTRKLHRKEISDGQISAF